MHTTFKHVVHHVNANPAIYVGHALWSRVMPSSERMRVSNMLLGVRDPLFAFGSDVLDYYRAPQGPQVSRGMASGHRLIKSIEATTAQFATLNTRSLNDPRHFWTRRAISRGANLKTPEEAQMSKRAVDHDVVADGCRQVFQKAHRAYVVRRTLCLVSELSARPPRFRVGLSSIGKHGRRSHSIF